METRQKLRNGIILFSFFLFPAIFYYLSPVVIIRAALNGIINGSFIIFALLFVSALIFGRGYCGWVCPAGGCQEAILQARDKKIKRGNYIKWIIWGPWISAIVFFAIKAGGYHEIDFFYETTYGLSIGNIQALIIYYIVLLLLIVLPSFVFGKRSFCHHICWMAPFLIIGRKIRNRLGWSSLQIRAEPEKCNHCHTCVNNCPMSLPVELMVKTNKMENSECILCGTCIDGCEFSVIRFAFFTEPNNGIKGEGKNPPRFMPGVGKKIRHISAMFSFIVLSLSGCGTDEFSAPFIQLQKRLDDYQISKNAAPVHEWVSQYHGEAPGHQMMITFVEWGNLYVPEMNILLKKWPATERSETFDRLKWAAADSGQPIKFAIPDAGQQAGAAGTR